MNDDLPGAPEAERRHRRASNEIRTWMRELSVELTMLNLKVGTLLDLKDVDMKCLDLVTRDGPLPPSALARRAGLHPATLTGVLDRLERDGWVTRERAPTDRRATLIRAVPKRTPEVFELYAGMNGLMDEIFQGYDETELAVIADFVRRTAQAGRQSAALLDGE